MANRHFVLPDVQLRPGDDVEFLRCIGRYLVKKQPEVLICLGDFADLPSLSSYDVGKKSFEGRRYLADIEAAKLGMSALLEPIQQYNEKQRKNGKKQYKPDMHFTLGNHCDRINRAVESDPKIEGVLSIKDLAYESFGWKVHPFLEVISIDGVAYSHYFISGMMGRPCSSAAAQLSKKHQSCVSGHQQGLQIVTGHRADGKRLTSIIAGSCYESTHDYLGPQGNRHWKGALLLHSVSDGEFDTVPLPLHYFKERYGQ